MIIIQVINGDILSWKMYETINEHKINYVFNLAAEPYIPKCYDNPEKFFDVNVKGTMNLLMACKTFGVKRIIHFSSSEVYGSAQYIPMDEKHPLIPLSTYAVSKLAADRMCAVFCDEHNIPVVIVRPFNAYGPRETQPYVIPEIISQLSKSNIVNLGNINAKRDFTYVDDTAKGAIAIMMSKASNGEVINIGSNKSYSIKELAHLIGKLMGHDSIEIKIDKTKLRPKDVDILHSDNTKIKKYTEWEPTINIEKGMKLTIKWFKENKNHWIWENLI